MHSEGLFEVAEELITALDQPACRDHALGEIYDLLIVVRHSTLSPRSTSKPGSSDATNSFHTSKHSMSVKHRQRQSSLYQSHSSAHIYMIS